MLGTEREASSQGSAMPIDTISLHWRQDKDFSSVKAKLKLENYSSIARGSCACVLLFLRNSITHLRGKLRFTPGTSSVSRNLSNATKPLNSALSPFFSRKHSALNTFHFLSSKSRYWKETLLNNPKQSIIILLDPFRETLMPKITSTRKKPYKSELVHRLAHILRNNMGKREIWYFIYNYISVIKRLKAYHRLQTQLSSLQMDNLTSNAYVCVPVSVHVQMSEIVSTLYETKIKEC